MKRSNEKTLWMLALGIAGIALGAACGGGESRSRKSIRGNVENSAAAPAPGASGGAATTQAAGGPKKVDPATAGTITGIVKWDGARPTPEALDLSGNPDCSKAIKETVYKEDLVVNADNTVAFAFVSIDTNDVYETPTEPVVIDQIGCHYVPHVLAAMVGQKIKIKSSDATLHNVHYLGTVNTDLEDNFAMPAPGVRERSFTAADWVKFKCDVHPWMGAWLAVRSHPFFAVTGTDGKFTIASVPAGTHKLVMKHESLGEQSVTVTVEAGKTATAEFTLKK